MNKAYQNIPFLRLLLSLTAGIIAGTWLPPLGTLFFVLICLSFFSLLIINRFYQYRSEIPAGILFLFLFFLIGAFQVQFYNRKPVFYDNGVYSGTIAESPTEKPNSIKTLVTLDNFIRNDSVFPTSEKMIVYLEKSPEATNLAFGEKIYFTGKVQSINNRGNPGEFDYKNYLQKQRIYRQVYLKNSSWIGTGMVNQKSVFVFSENLRNKLLDVYRTQNLGETEFQILAALVIGYRQELDPEVIQVFSNTGAMHILSVSGFHVGILFWGLNLLLGFLKKRQKGKFIYVLAISAIVWFYALLTGLSPSVNRAALMITLYITGENLIRKTSIYNTLATSAMFLLLINPNNLYDVGFQLSYLAVFGIVFLQPRFAVFYTPGNRIFKYFWTILTVSVAAQISTLPLTLYYFNQFPVYFLLTNLFIIPVSQLIIPSGILLLFAHRVALLSGIFSFTTKWLLKTGYFLLQWVDSLPHSTALVNTDFAVAVILSLLIGFCFLYVAIRSTVILKLILTMALLLVVTSNLNLFKTLRSSYLLFYNNPENPIVYLKTGNHAYIVQEKTGASGNYTSRFISQVIKKSYPEKCMVLPSDTVYEDHYILIDRGLISFRERIIAFGPADCPAGLRIHFKLVNAGLKLDNLAENPETIYIDTGSPPVVKNTISTLKIHPLVQDGALRIDL